MDGLRLSMSIPCVLAQRRLALRTLVEARSARLERLPWSAIFTKAYALLAEETTELRRVYLQFPFPRLYEYPRSIAVVAIERTYRGESIVYPLMIRKPQTLGLGAIGRAITEAKAVDLDTQKDFRLAMRFAGLPGPLRRGLLWMGLNSGRHRAKIFGTYGVTVVASQQAEFLHLISPVPNVLNYGPFCRGRHSRRPHHVRSPGHGRRGRCPRARPLRRNPQWTDCGRTAVAWCALTKTARRRVALDLQSVLGNEIVMELRQGSSAAEVADRRSEKAVRTGSKKSIRGSAGA